MSDQLFEDARLASLYDEMCTGREDTAWYVARRRPAPTGADRVVMR